MLSRVIRGLAAVAFLSLGAQTASAVTLGVIDNGLTNPNQNYGCTTGAELCGIPPLIWLDQTALATGTITIDDAVTVANIVLHIDYALFDRYDPSPDDVTFTDVTYMATIPIQLYGSSIFQNGVGSATVEGNANGAPFSVTPQVTSFTCGSIVAPTQCGIQFGEAGFTTVGDDFVHTFNVLVTPVPEPMAGLLLALGLAGLLLRTRSS